jgi:hypothetical protein
MAYITNEEAELYAEDGIHPTKLGSYLAACTFYTLIFGDTPEGGEIPGSIDANDGSLVQSIAGNTVLYNEEEWNIGPIVSADILFETGEVFTTMTMETSAAVDSVWVDNGTDTTTWHDGETGAITFDESGTYYFVLHVFSPCGDEMIIDSIEIVTRVPEMDLAIPFTFPNPAQQYVELKNIPEHLDEILIYNNRGELCRVLNNPGENQVVKLDLSNLNTGKYFVILVTDNHRHVIPITKM